MSQTPPNFPNQPAPGQPGAPGQFNPAPQPPAYGAPPPSAGTSSSKVVLIVLLCMIPVCLCGGGVLVGLMLPAVQAAREAARRMECSNNMKQIGLALHNYHDAYKQFPPAYTTNWQGQPMHSWRTSILPFMEQQPLYERIDWDQPWDSPANAFLQDAVVPTYSCPSTPMEPTLTTYVAVVDAKTAFTGAQGMQIRDFLDGTSNTILMVETSTANARHWADPTDIDLPTYLGASGNFSHPGGYHVLMADGSVRFLTLSIESGLNEALTTRAGGEEIGLNY